MNILQRIIDEIAEKAIVIDGVIQHSYNPIVNDAIQFYLFSGDKLRFIVSTYRDVLLSKNRLHNLNDIMISILDKVSATPVKNNILFSTFLIEIPPGCFRIQEYREKAFQLNLSRATKNDLKKFLEIDRQHQPKNVLVIFDGDKPRLAVVRGDREIWLYEDPSWYGTRMEYLGDKPYLHIISTDPKDKEIFFQRDTYFSPVGFWLKKGMTTDFYIKNDFRQAGTITITKKDGTSLLIQAEQGEEIIREDKLVEVKV